MKEKILDALKKLDPANEDHWTSDGLPRLDVVNTHMEGAQVTRQQITEVAKGFTQKNPTLETAPEGEQKAPDNASEVQAPVQQSGPSITLEGKKDQPTTPADKAPQDERQVLEKAVEVAEANAAKAQSKVKEARDALDKYILSKEKDASSPHAHALCVKEFQESQRKQREAQVAGQANLMRLLSSQTPVK